jgi:hypothetical protein
MLNPFGILTKRTITDDRVLVRHILAPVAEARLLPRQRDQSLFQFRIVAPTALSVCPVL